MARLEITTELATKIDSCRQATKEYRDAFAKADKLRSELQALGLCGHCAIGNHGHCQDYGCECCGGGK
jgi:hypothetical protein